MNDGGERILVAVCTPNGIFWKRFAVPQRERDASYTSLTVAWCRYNYSCALDVLFPVAFYSFDEHRERRVGARVVTAWMH